MNLRWTTEAAVDLERIADCLFDKTPQNAARVLKRIYDATSRLSRFPYRGRVGKKAGTRELVMPSLPYIIVYRLGTEVVYITRILHGAQKWVTISLTYPEICCMIAGCCVRSPGSWNRKGSHVGS